MRPPRHLVRFLLGLAVVYGLLLVPWPGLRSGYCTWLCGLARTVFSHEHGRLLVRFEPDPPGPGHPLDTRITVADRARIAADGTVPARVLGLDSWGFGWVPTALLVALIVATPVPWRRRAWALAGGLIAIHGFLVAVIGVYVLNNADAAGTPSTTTAPFWKAILDGLEETFVTQMGPGFAVAVVIWVLVTFRREDWPLLVTSGKPAITAEAGAKARP